MNRRNFITVTTGAIGGGLLCGAPLAHADDVKLKGRNVMCCETYSLRTLIREKKLDMETVPALYKELGIKGISYNDMFFPQDAWEHKDLLDRVKAAVTAADRKVIAYIIEGNIATPNEEARRKQLEHDKNAMRVGAYLGAAVVRVNLGGVGPGEDNATVGVERCVTGFNELLPLAKELKLKITMENHGGVSGTAENILAIINKTDRKWVGSCLDFGNWSDAVRYESCEKLAAYAYHTHAKSHSFNADGEESQIDYQRVLAMMKAAKYKGAISVEFEGGGDQVEGVKKTRDLVVKHWNA